MTKPIQIKSNKDSSILEIGWNPTNVCNFKCRYCFPENNTGTHRTPSNLNLIVDNFRHTLDYYKENLGKTKFQFFVAGGEPTLWKELGTFISKIKEKHNVYFTLISNGSRTLRWWKEHAHEIDNAHLTHHLAEGDIEHITKVADILFESGAKTTVKVLMDPLHWDKGIEAVNYMKKNSQYSWFILTEKVIEPDAITNSINSKTLQYTPAQLKYLKRDLKRMPGILWFWKNRQLLKQEIRLHESRALLDNGKKINARPGTYLKDGWNNFKDWKCTIGINRLYIDWTGRLSGACTSKLFELDYYYNILDNDFKEKFAPSLVPTICKYTSCWCSPETHLTKHKIIPITEIKS